MKTVLVLAPFIFLAACGDANQNTSSNTANRTEASGQAIYEMKCGICHKESGASTGPALKGVIARWNGDTSRIQAFIRDPSKMIAAADPQANAVYEKYKPVVMNGFPDLSPQQLQEILQYIQAIP